MCLRCCLLLDQRTPCHSLASAGAGLFVPTTTWCCCHRCCCCSHVIHLRECLRCANELHTHTHTHTSIRGATAETRATRQHHLHLQLATCSVHQRRVLRPAGNGECQLITPIYRCACARHNKSMSNNNNSHTHTHCTHTRAFKLLTHCTHTHTHEPQTSWPTN